MVKASKLEYNTVYNALKNGDFYSSNGPLIYDLYYEDGFIYIKTSVAKKIYLTSESRFTLSFYSEEGVTEAKFDISKFIRFDESKHKYIRITVVDEFGKEAHTKAYHLADFLDEEDYVEMVADGIIKKHIVAFEELSK